MAENHLITYPYRCLRDFWKVDINVHLYLVLNDFYGFQNLHG